MKEMHTIKAKKGRNEWIKNGCRDKNCCTEIDASVRCIEQVQSLIVLYEQRLAVFCYKIQHIPCFFHCLTYHFFVLWQKSDCVTDISFIFALFQDICILFLNNDFYFHQALSMGVRELLYSNVSEL